MCPRMFVLQIIKLITVSLFLSQALGEKDKQKDFILNFHQNDYQLKAERIEIVRDNKQYIDVTVKTFKYNRTCTAFNLTAVFHVDMGNKAEFVVQTYKFASNEYRLFPMRFQLNACDAFSKDVFGIAKITICGGNITNCPLKKGKLEVCNFTPDPSHFPPLIPNGKYMWEVEVFYLSEEVGVARAYFEVFRPFV